MKPTTFTHKKNQILFDLTGIILVPEDQIEDCEVKELFSDSDDLCCPYCRVYLANNCVNCPMAVAGNRCSMHTSSTYYQIINVVHPKIIAEIPKIIDLVNEYNQSNGFN